MSTREIKPSRILNVLGLFCPEPVFRTKLEVQTMAVGEVLEVLADDPAAEEDIKKWSQRTGNEILDFSRSEKGLRFLIKKTC